MPLVSSRDAPVTLKPEVSAVPPVPLVDPAIGGMPVEDSGTPVESKPALPVLDASPPVVVDPVPVVDGPSPVLDDVAPSVEVDPVSDSSTSQSRVHGGPRRTPGSHASTPSCTNPSPQDAFWQLVRHASVSLPFPSSQSSPVSSSPSPQDAIATKNRASMGPICGTQMKSPWKKTRPRKVGEPRVGLFRGATACPLAPAAPEPKTTA